MSRSVKDLRELVCVSRLTIRESDDELSDEESLVRPFSSLSILDDGSTTVRKNLKMTSETDVTLVPKPPSSAKQKKFKRSKLKSESLRTHDQNDRTYTLAVSNNINEFQYSKKPLPPVLSRPSTSSSSSSNSDEVGPLLAGNFDNILPYMDENCVESFLRRANQMVAELSSWCHCNNNFVHFGEYWLHKVPDNQKMDLYQLEIGIITDELMFAFEGGIEQQNVRLSDIHKLISAVVREYPTRLCTLRGPYIFLDILDTLTLDKTDAYKELLTDVKISTRNRKFAEWMLATRAFALLNIWSAVINFYRKLTNDSKTITMNSSVPEIRSKDNNIQRAFVATGLGYVHFLHYLLRSNKFRADVLDSQKRSLVLEAVTSNQETALLYLLTKAKPLADVNRAADSGNVALHTAASMGSVPLVRMLLTKGHADVNYKNLQCDSATPLHLAVMQGHIEVCKVLIEAGADTKASMGGITPLDLATDMGHTDVVSLISSLTGIQSDSPMDT